MAAYLWILAGVVTVIVYHWRQLATVIRRRVRLIYYVGKIPGPFSIPILGTTWQFPLSTEQFVKKLMYWSDYYQAHDSGGVLRLWIGTSPLIVLVGADEIREVFESNTMITKGPEYEILKPWIGTGLLISTGDKWRSRRKMLTPTFHFNMLNGYLKTHDQEAQILVQQLQPMAKNGTLFDIFPFVKRCALDIICETAMGVKANAQIQHNCAYVTSVQRMNDLAFMYSRMPWFWLSAIWYGTGYGFEYDRHLKLLTDFTRKVIKERIVSLANENNLENSDRKKLAFLDLLLQMQRENKLNDEDIREEVDTFMFEGHDTTSSSMGWTLWCLAHHQEVQSRIVEELDGIFGDSDRSVTNDDLKEMKYLEQCIKESLRLFPAVPLNTRMIEEDTTIGGKLLPKGCAVVITTMAIHRNERYFTNPHSFDPENFSLEAIAKRHPYAFVPFSAGARNCIGTFAGLRFIRSGQKFALMEEKTVLAWILRRYRISSPVPFEDNSYLPEIILKPKLGIPVILSERHSKH